MNRIQHKYYAKQKQEILGVFLKFCGKVRSDYYIKLDVLFVYKVLIYRVEYKVLTFLFKSIMMG